MKTTGFVLLLLSFLGVLIMTSNVSVTTRASYLVHVNNLKDAGALADHQTAREMNAMRRDFDRHFLLVLIPAAGMLIGGMLTGLGKSGRPAAQSGNDNLLWIFSLMVVTGLAVSIAGETLSIFRMGPIFGQITSAGSDPEAYRLAVHRYMVGRYVSISGLLMLFLSFGLLLVKGYKHLADPDTARPSRRALFGSVFFLVTLVVLAGLGVLLQSTMIMSDGFLHFFGGRWQGSLTPALSKTYDGMRASHDRTLMTYVAILLLYGAGMCSYWITSRRNPPGSPPDQSG